MRFFTFALLFFFLSHLLADCLFLSSDFRRQSQGADRETGEVKKAAQRASGRDTLHRAERAVLLLFIK